MEFIKQLKCAGGNRNCIPQNAECILLQGFLPDLKTYLKTEEKFDVNKLPVQKRLVGPHMESPREGLAGTEWGGGPQGHAVPLYHTETQEDFSSRFFLLQVRKSSTGSHCSPSLLAEVAMQK